MRFPSMELIVLHATGVFPWEDSHSGGVSIEAVPASHGRAMLLNGDWVQSSVRTCVFFRGLLQDLAVGSYV